MTEHAQIDETPIPMSTGSRLKLARESKGLACEDIARDLKLDLKLIEALESDDVNNLPQPVYTAGYIRNYARLVELSADNMVADYVAQETKDLPSLPSTRVDSLPDRYRQVAEALPRSFSIAAANARNASPVQYVAIAIGVVLAILIGWQSSRMFNDNTEVQQAQNDGALIVTNQGDNTPENDSAAEIAEGDASLSSNQSGVQTELPSSRGSGDALSSPNSAQFAQTDDRSNQKDASATAVTESRIIRKEKNESVSEQIEMAESIGISMNDNPSQQMPQSGNKIPNSEDSAGNIDYVEKDLKLKDLPGESTEGEALALLQLHNSTDLTLTFTRNSWVDIRDATGKRLIRKLGIAGNSQKVNGVAPFQVLLGFGHGVTIEYNGKAVDFSAFQGNTVARFTLEVPVEKEVPGENL